MVAAVVVGLGCCKFWWIQLLCMVLVGNPISLRIVGVII